MNLLLRVLLVLACFELGILLILAPWTAFWEQNYFINHYPSLIPILLHPSARGIVSGLGVLDIILAAGMLRRRRRILCYVTDRHGLPRPLDSGGAEGELVDRIRRAIEAGVDWIQIREKDLSTPPLTSLVAAAVSSSRARRASTRIIVNDRLDVALATGAAGVHLGGESVPVAEVAQWKRKERPSNGFLVGASCHSLEAAKAAERDGADYVIFGPVFETPSKQSYGPPQGLERLAEVCRAVRIPVLAIGGVTLTNAASCLHAGAAGLAAIRMFQEVGDAEKLADVVATLRG